MSTFADLQLTNDSGDEDDSDDEEYVPGKDEDEDASSCSGESLSELDPDEDGEQKGAKVASKLGSKKASKGRRGKRPQKAKAQNVLMGDRVRRGGIRLDVEEADANKEAPQPGPDNPPASEASSVAPAASSKSAKSPEAAVGAEEPNPAERRRADALWASFLSDVGPRPVSKAATPPVQQPEVKQRPSAISGSSAPSTTTTKTKIFDFAGESVAVPVPTASASSSSSAKRPSSGGGSSGGVQGLLDRLTKRPKISTLEKSRLDWEGFKSAEGISEELATHNRGRAGFLERQAFLERADYRQFELERDARLAGQRQGHRKT